MAFKLIWLIFFCYNIGKVASCKGRCHIGFELQRVCTNSQQLKCGSPLMMPQSNNCRTREACRCPDSSPFLWGFQCYKQFECPKKSHDLPSNNQTGHNFVVPGRLRSDGRMYGMHVSALKLPMHWYHGIALFQFIDPKCAVHAQNAQIANPKTFLSINYRVPIKLVDLLKRGKKFTANIGLGVGPAFQFVKKCELTVEQVLDLRRYKADQPSYPQYQKYFLFGNCHDTFMSHLPTKCKDFQQIVWLDSAPDGFTRRELLKGTVIEIPSLSGQPPMDRNMTKVIDPLTDELYDILPTMSQISIRRKYQFDSFIVNIGCK